MTGRHGLGDAFVFSGPANAPLVHSANAVRPILAQQLRQRLVAQAASGGKRVVIMMAPVVGRFPPSATATVICAITVAPPRPIRLRSASSTWQSRARRLNRGIHAGGARTDHQDISFSVHWLRQHVCLLEMDPTS